MFILQRVSHIFINTIRLLNEWINLEIVDCGKDHVNLKINLQISLVTTAYIFEYSLDDKFHRIDYKINRLYAQVEDFTWPEYTKQTG